PELKRAAADALLAPHRSYLACLRPLLGKGSIKGLAHITGGGITENLPRTLPEGCAAEIDTRAWDEPPVFRVIQQRGQIGTAAMFGAFSMGFGMMVVCAARDADRVINPAAKAGEPNARRIGVIIPGARSIRYL